MNRREYDQLKFDEASRLLFGQHGVSVDPKALARYFSPAAKAVRHSHAREFARLANAHSPHSDTDTRRRRLQLAELEEDWTPPCSKVRPGKTKRGIVDLIHDGFISRRAALPDPGTDKRISALVKVLCRLPDDDYEALKAIVNTGKVYFDVPHANLAGQVGQVTSYVHCTLYLSPSLETKSDREVEYYTAHELAHLMLHSDFKEDKATAERQADQKVVAWGFKRLAGF